MAQRKTQQLEGQSAASIAQKARRSKELATISEIADQNLNPTDGWKTILPEHIEAIKTRLIGGDTLSNACRGMGINEQSVTRYFHENKEALREFLDWKSFGSHIMWDRLIDMINNLEMSPSDKMFAFKVINAYTTKINREVYGEKVQMEVVQHQPVILDWNSIVGEGGDGV
ncbi:hypothetical protein [Sphingomonas sp. R1]|uniref:hypothetical protein n=1 Tax=Sphingomonas sp. R1 TaxID=399176 RepID=UPI0022259152|nr:hypothetical protein [Sphingomonas sp. R1]UYY77509.1 hypothetical protein OIM94_00400 [Sphingomonas sp. R1]